MVRRHVQVLAVDGRLERDVVVEDDRSAGVAQQSRLAGTRFDDTAVGSEIALEHGQRALLVDRLVERAYHVVAVDRRALKALPPRPPGHVDLRQIKKALQ